MKRLLLTTTAATFALGSAAFGASMIDVSGAAIQGDTVTLPAVMADADGYVVIHRMVDGEPAVPQSIGHTMVPAGESANVAVTVDQPFVAGENYFAMLHQETNGNGTYDFAEGMTDVDTPVMDGGQVVGVAFAVPAMNDAGMTTSSTMADPAMENAGGQMIGDENTLNSSTAVTGQAGASPEEQGTPSGGLIPGQTPE
ncbi:DUF7282 domain-containing protein [Jiella marina]|uniref:DUF7282 domain-containing protein n=1 Tax=Jiella sp. LLJ827 TaxID=2917712 RepID=UPI002100BB9C|nr:hypothetical protein [Jiella sp. LLJ827]MCQ0987845.1 hypothetical protein [Jiella sp. LLJ827]